MAVPRNVKALLTRGGFQKPSMEEVFTLIAEDNAMVNGGIDLNGRKMGLNVAKDGQGIQMKVDSAMIAEFQKGNFTGVQGIILRIVPIQSPLPLLGLDSRVAADKLVKM